MSCVANKNNSREPSESHLAIRYLTARADFGYCTYIFFAFGLNYNSVASWATSTSKVNKLCKIARLPQQLVLPTVIPIAVHSEWSWYFKFSERCKIRDQIAKKSEIQSSSEYSVFPAVRSGGATSRALNKRKQKGQQEAPCYECEGLNRLTASL